MNAGNESNLIGSCWSPTYSQSTGRLSKGGNGGFLTASNTYALAGWRKAVWLINRDAGDALLAVAQANGWTDQLRRIGLVTGALEVDYSTSIIDFASSVGDHFYDHIDDTAHHLYLKTHPRTAAPAIRTANGIETLRKAVNARGGGASEFWLTEGMYAGSDRWNQYQFVYNGVDGTGTKADATSWMTAADKTKAGVVHNASDVNQKEDFADFLNYLKEKNDDPVTPWGVAAVIPHVLFDEKVSDSGDGYTYWQNCRGMAWRIPGDANLSTYTTASGTPRVSPNWKGVALAYRDAWDDLGGLTAPPAPVITGKPSATTTATGGTFTFTDARAGVTFSRSLDGAAYTTVTSPDVVSSLAVGSHLYRIKAVDSGGTSPITSYSWTINGVGSPPPDPTFTSQPTDGPDVTVTLAFTDSNGTATFQGRLDGAAYATVTSPVTLTNLSEGSHQYDIVAVTGSLKSGVVSAAWVTTSPVTPPPAPTFVSTPASVITVREAVFVVTDTQPGVTYQYRLDGSTEWTDAATDTITLTALTLGAHTFEVRALDASSGVSTAASYSWTVQNPVTPPPVETPRRSIYTWVLKDRHGRTIAGAIRPFDRLIYQGVSQDPYAELSINAESRAAYHVFTKAMPRLMVWRKNKLVFHGEAWTQELTFQQTDPDADPEATDIPNVLKVTFKSIERLHHRYPGGDNPIILDGDRYDKTSGLISATNTGVGFTGIRTGDRDGKGPEKKRKFEAGSSAGDVLDQLFPRGGGPGEYKVRPVAGTKRTVSYPGGDQDIQVMCQIDVHYPRVGNRKSCVFRFHPGGGNTANGSYVKDMHQHVNYATALGESIGTKRGMPISSPYQSPAAIAKYGMLERQEQGQKGHLNDLAASLLHLGAGETITITPGPDAPRYWEDFEAGDSVRFVFRIGSIVVSKRFRVWDATIQFDDEGIDSLGDITVGNVDEDDI